MQKHLLSLLCLFSDYTIMLDWKYRLTDDKIILSGTLWQFRTLWPLFGFTTCWLSWMTNTAALLWRTTSCCSTTSARSRGICRSELRAHTSQWSLVMLMRHFKYRVVASAGSIPGRSRPYGHDYFQKP